MFFYQQPPNRSAFKIRQANVLYIPSHQLMPLHLRILILFYTIIYYERAVAKQYNIIV